MRDGGGRAAAGWSGGMGVTLDSWEQESADLQSWHEFGVEIWKSGLSPWLVAMRATYYVIPVNLCVCVTGTEQRLLVPTGVTGKARQRSRAAVGRIQAGEGSAPGSAACDWEECSET